jgi:hypothetical protein
MLSASQEAKGQAKGFQGAKCRSCVEGNHRHSCRLFLPLTIPVKSLPSPRFNVSSLSSRGSHRVRKSQKRTESLQEGRRITGLGVYWGLLVRGLQAGIGRATILPKRGQGPS